MGRVRSRASSGSTQPRRGSQPTKFKPAQYMGNMPKSSTSSFSGNCCRQPAASTPTMGGIPKTSQPTTQPTQSGVTTHKTTQPTAGTPHPSTATPKPSTPPQPTTASPNPSASGTGTAKSPAETPKTDVPEKKSPDGTPKTADTKGPSGETPKTTAGDEKKTGGEEKKSGHPFSSVLSSLGLGGDKKTTDGKKDTKPEPPPSADGTKKKEEAKPKTMEDLRREHGIPDQKVQDAMKTMHDMLGENGLGGKDGKFDARDIYAIRDGLMRDPHVQEEIRRNIDPNQVRAEAHAKAVNSPQANSGLFKGIKRRVAANEGAQAAAQFNAIAANPNAYHRGMSTQGTKHSGPVNPKAMAEAKARPVIDQQLAQGLQQGGVTAGWGQPSDTTSRNVTRADMDRFQAASKTIQDYIKANPTSPLAKAYDPRGGADRQQLADGLKRIQDGEKLLAAYGSGLNVAQGVQGLWNNMFTD